MLLRDDGAAVAFGDNGAGQCEVPPPRPGCAFLDAAAGAAHTLLVQDDGAVVCVGAADRHAEWAALVDAPSAQRDFYDYLMSLRVKQQITKDDLARRPRRG